MSKIGEDPPLRLITFKREKDRCTSAAQAHPCYARAGFPRTATLSWSGIRWDYRTLD